MKKLQKKLAQLKPFATPPSCSKDDQSSTYSNKAGSSIYKPLNTTRKEIRLLKIEPGSGLNTPRCRLITRSLTLRPPPYETISYCWGNATVRGQVFVNDRIVDVPRSAEMAIRAARFPDRSRTVWLDSICINQSDLIEKTSQIANMGTLYSKGICNIVYLGEDHNGIARRQVHELHSLFPFIENAVNGLEEDVKERWTRYGQLPDSWNIGALMNSDTFKHLEPLIRLDWFRRVWTMQECALAQRNICKWGEEELDLLLILDAVRIWASGLVGRRDTNFRLDLLITNAAGLAILHHLIQRERAPSEADKYQFHSFHQLATGRLAKEPHDHVFGLLGIMEKVYNWRTIPELLQPNYQKTPHEVFRDATRAALELENDSILRMIRHGPQRSKLLDPGYTSWTVPWDRPEQEVATPRAAYAGKRGGIDAQEDTLSLQPATIDADALIVEGYLLDAISWIDEGNYVFLSARTLADENFGLARLVQHLRQQVQTRYQVLTIIEEYEIIVSILTRGGWNESIGVDLGPGVPTRYDSLRKAAEALEKLLVYLQQHGQNYYLDPERARLQRMMYSEIRQGGTFFALEDGHVGFGPEQTQAGIGQKLFIMRGGLYPHIVQPEGDHWRYVGVAYAYELMNGEVYDMGIESQWLCIK